MWSNCHANFASMSELVGHVNLQHLRIPSPPRSQPTYPPPNLKPVAEDLSCQWDNCHDYPTAQSIPGSSSSTSLDAALGVLADHLLHDHLGLQQQPQASPSTTLSFTDPLQNTSSLEEPPALEHVDQEDADGAASETSTCQWHDCGATFTGVDDLTAHINTVHVVGGKAHYECFWDGCNRSGDKGFASKQKICRHIQSHTGHRPFQCKLCKQYFSEAATLQQHMRRHTQEKPYLCDFPGCGKAFAIAGALTIHKRTHNGHKPFKCTYCDRGFSESSNLSKHLRTHTGVRPYTCVESGCVKSFSRPDQLARHMLVHKKKAAA
ncbi:hypothetical protein BV25DRAFT_1809863 [Artomyces pyxidatus]|uniref:Uncharacterized protein n=1 Tax=Artomyces pyxidatus TaxID=48021 RepID=A0ACB8SQX4_9AGAM|nr:hypothetical protein BV25DRAFT_1809863 [Artomyces pyxidatus]